MRAELLLTNLALATLVALAGCSGKSEADLLASAKDYLQKNDDKAAVIQLKNVLQQQPASGEARFLLGQALLHGGDAAGAEVELRRAHELKFDAPHLIPLLSQAMLRQGEFDKLTQQFASTELHDPQAMVALQLALAQAYAVQRAPDKARDRVAKALALQPDSLEALLALARIKAAAAEYDDALAATVELLVKHPDSVDGWTLKGDLLARAKADTNGAIAAYQKAVALQPRRAELHAALISLYFANQDLAAAKRQSDAMKDAAPNDAVTKFTAAQVLFARADYKGAQQALQALLRDTPENPAVLNLAGATEMKLRSSDTAEPLLSKAVLLRPDFLAARQLLAKVQLQKNQPARALSTLRPVLATADAETLLIAGQAALINGDPQGADRYFARAAASGADNAKTRTAAALSQLAQGHAAEAVGELQSLAASDNGATADLALISARLSMADYPGALKAIDALDKKRPGSALAADLRGRVGVLRRDVPEARRHFEAALQRDPRYLPAVMNLAAIDAVQNQPEAARARFDAYLKLEPKSVPALLALASLKQRGGGTPDEVAVLIKAAVNANPLDAEPRLALVNHYLRLGDTQAALATAQAAAAAVPNDPDVQDKLARTLMAGGDVNQALSIFGKLATQQPDLAAGHLGLAEASLAKKDFDAAYKSAKRALELAPRSLAAQRLAVMSAMSAKRPQDALAVARDMQAQRPKESLGYILEGEIALNQQQPDAAAAAFRKALATSHPAQAPARLHATLLQAKKDAEASKFAGSWLQSHPKDALFLFYLGDGATARGDYTAAEKPYRALLQLQPDNAIALNNLANVLMQQGKPGVLALAEQANKAAPGQPALMDTLATALAADKQYAKAIELQKQAIEKAPHAAALKLNLAKIYIQSGDRAQARSELEALQKSGNDFPQRGEAGELLKAVSSS